MKNNNKYKFTVIFARWCGRRNQCYAQTCEHRTRIVFLLTRCKSQVYELVFALNQQMYVSYCLTDNATKSNPNKEICIYPRRRQLIKHSSECSKQKRFMCSEVCLVHMHHFDVHMEAEAMLYRVHHLGSRDGLGF